MDFSKIKLIIWDLDDTIWKGTLSEDGADGICLLYTSKYFLLQTKKVISLRLIYKVQCL